jgi:hypothetical protein
MAVPKSQHCYWEVCTKFNEADIVARAQRRALETIVENDNPDPQRDLPYGTLSVKTFFKMRNGPIVAFTHHYKYPEGTPTGFEFADGPRTPHDPKWVLVFNERWYPGHTDRGRCPDCPKWRDRARETRSKA